MQKLGTILVIVGILLILGNLSGAFRTFPFAGCLTIMFGSWLSKQR